MKLRENRGWVISANVVMCILSFLALAPFVLLIISSFTDETAALTNGYSYLPKAWSLHAYEYILNQKAMLGRAYMMTIVVTAVGTSVGVVMTAMLGYMLSQKGLPGRKFCNYFIVFTMLFNGGLVPTYIMYVRMLHIKNTIFGLIVPNMLMSSFMVMLVRNYFENSVPRDLYEACRIDGATEFQHHVNPENDNAHCNNLLIINWQNGLYYLSDSSKHLYTIQNILNNINDNIAFLASNATSGVSLAELPTTTVRMAIAVVGILPILILYPFFQKYFAKGITMGAVKG